MVSRILSEFRRKRNIALLERVGKTEYRVTLCRRYKSLDKAQEAYLSEVPKGSRDYYINEIKENLSNIGD